MPCVPAPACGTGHSPQSLDLARAGPCPELIRFPVSKAGGPRCARNSGLTVWARILPAVGAFQLM